MTSLSTSKTTAPGPAVVVLVRHGATAWSRNGRHTGRTDLPLDEGGEEQARIAGNRLEGRTFDAVFTSPLVRASETCRLAGFGDRAVVLDDLQEWDYGAYEGLTTAEIREQRPGWQIFADGAPEGESPEQIGARADRALSEITAMAGEKSTVAIFSHGHFLRVFAARWLALPPGEGRHFALDPASVSELGYERDIRVMQTWNS